MISYINNVAHWITNLWNYLYENISNLNVVIQLISIALLMILSLFIRHLINIIVKKTKKLQQKKFVEVFRFIKSIIIPFSLLIFLLIVRRIFILTSYSYEIIQIFVSLSSLWVIIVISTYFISNPFLKKVVLFFAMLIAILSSFGYLDEAIKLLDSISVDLSGSRISLYSVIKASIYLMIFGWLVKHLIKYIETKLIHNRSIKPSLAVLIIKISKIVFYALVFLLVISNVGINLKAFTILTGAIGIGIGFGLQKVVSNLISGVILLLDDSVKPGDIIEVSNDFGKIKTMGARYIEVEAIDGREYLIPNEELITTRVVNWSHSNNLLRINVDVGVSYKSDPNIVKSLLEEIPSKFDRILTNPRSICYLKQFGESSIDFSLSFWINDPSNGIKNIKSDILFEIWNVLKDNGIEIPFPQRDIYIKSQ